MVVGSGGGQRWWAAVVGSGGGQRWWAAVVGSGGGQRWEESSAVKQLWVGPSSGGLLVSRGNHEQKLTPYPNVLPQQRVTGQHCCEEH